MPAIGHIHIYDGNCGSEGFDFELLWLGSSRSTVCSLHSSLIGIEMEKLEQVPLEAAGKINNENIPSPRQRSRNRRQQ